LIYRKDAEAIDEKISLCSGLATGAIDVRAHASCRSLILPTFPPRIAAETPASPGDRLFCVSAPVSNVGIGSVSSWRLLHLENSRLAISACPLAVAGLTVMRGVFAAFNPLRVDEAYYWTWSRENVISYLDHPPMVAWCVAFGTQIFGDTNFGVRFSGLLAMLVMHGAAYLQVKTEGEIAARARKAAGIAALIVIVGLMLAAVVRLRSLVARTPPASSAAPAELLARVRIETENSW